MSLYDTFNVDENGNVIMDPADPVEVVENGNVTVPSDQIGDMVETPEVVPEDNVEIEEGSSSNDILVDNSGNVNLLSVEDELLAIAASVSPAGGSLGSSTLDFFDRVVSGLPSDYKYIAYRTSADDSYDGILYFSDDFDIINNRISFDECEVIEVVRESSSGYNNVTNYYTRHENDIDINYNLSGSVIYYTNAQPGYPVLGSIVQPLSYSPILVGSIVCSVIIAVLTKIIRR